MNVLKGLYWQGMWILFLLCFWLYNWSCVPPHDHPSPPFQSSVWVGGWEGSDLVVAHAFCLEPHVLSVQSVHMFCSCFSFCVRVCQCAGAWSSDTVGSVERCSAFCSRRPEIHSCNLWHDAGVKAAVECKDYGWLNVILSFVRGNSELEQLETSVWALRKCVRHLSKCL